MFYCLVYYLQEHIDQINKIRIKYDPTYNLVDPHVTLIYPLPSSIGKNNITNHVTEILKKWTPIDIQFGGLTKSWDHWLFLTLLSGESDIIRLSDDLYSGFIAEFRRADIENIPHVGLGLFAENQSDYDWKDPQKFKFDEKSYNLALAEADSLKLNFQSTVDILDLLELNNDLTEIKTIKKFSL
jgi:hypothetical protein